MSYNDQTIPTGTGAVPLWAPHYGAPVGLWAPHYGAPVGEALKRFFKKYATFSGRASRSEYWWVALFSSVVSLVLEILIAVGTHVDAPGKLSLSGGAITGLILAGIWVLGLAIPSLALTVRRLHDVNVSGWMVLIGLVPFGSLAILVSTLQKAKPEGQRFDLPATR